ncbi:MAG: hypothetical protein LCH96_18675 [Actinobacteria bacterium]|nr:hypothetical protein [Actinomycetota bacterium]
MPVPHAGQLGAGDGGHSYVLGAERAAAANALPRQILDEIDDSPDRYTPTGAALVAMFDAGLRHFGHRFDPATETVQLTNPIRELRIPAIHMIHLFDTAEMYNDPEEYWDDDCRSGLPWMQLVDCDRRIEDEFSRETLLSPYDTNQATTAAEPPLNPAPPEPEPRPTPGDTGVEPLGDIGQMITVTGTVLTACRLPPNRWNTKPRALLILDHGPGRVKTVTSAAWAHRITTGQQLTLTGTVTGHATSHGQPLTILARPQPARPGHEPDADPAAGPPPWEQLRPAPGKARPYPARPTHWPRRHSRREPRPRKEEQS